MQPSGDGTRAGFYYVNTYDLKSRPLYELEALSLDVFRNKDSLAQRLCAMINAPIMQTTRVDHE
jgi:hypothetical protein